MNLPVNLKILLTALLNPVNYGKKSVVDNIGPSIQNSDPHCNIIPP
jgi:hypothetical protein